MLFAEKFYNEFSIKKTHFQLCRTKLNWRIPKNNDPKKRVPRVGQNYSHKMIRPHTMKKWWRYVIPFWRIFIFKRTNAYSGEWISLLFLRWKIDSDWEINVTSKIQLRCQRQQFISPLFLIVFSQIRQFNFDSIKSLKRMETGNSVHIDSRSNIIMYHRHKTKFLGQLQPLCAQRVVSYNILRLCSFI